MEKNKNQYKKNSAGAIMTSEFFSLNSKISVDEAIKKLQEASLRDIFYIYVTDDDNFLIGVVPVKRLVVASQNIEIDEIINRDIIRVTVNVDQEEVANLARKHNLRAVPVVDETNKLVGIVTSSSLLNVITEEASEDIYHMAGIGGEKLFQHPIFTAIRFRLPWLIICLLGGIIAAGVISAFEETLAAVVVLAAFIPIIMDMGGNVGTQSSTIIIRGLATKSIDLKDSWQHLWQELRIGLLMGVICGGIVGMIAQIWKGTSYLGIVVGVSMIATITIAASLGALLPIFFQRIGVDPAVASGPVITTIKDITGLVIYFSVATLLIL